MLEIIMIEDDEEITKLLQRFLPKYNMNVTGFSSVSTALNSLEIDRYDLLILDLSLPEMDGLEVCKIVTQKYDLPIIISSARSDLNDKLLGLSLGADDYLPKPYDPRELVARIQTVLRRMQKNGSIEHSNEFEIQESSMKILQQGKTLDLTMAEYEIFKLLLEKKGSVVSREYIANNASSMRWDSSDRSIDVIVYRLRQKIGDTPKNSSYIKSIRGVGYMYIGS